MSENTKSTEHYNVLVVDDYLDAAEMLSVLLTMMGQRCQVAHCGRDGLALAQAHPPQLAILDIGLPDISGYELARELRQVLGNEVYLVAMTGWGQAEDRARAFEAGFDQHLLKPAEPAMIRDLLARVGQRRLVTHPAASAPG